MREINWKLARFVLVLAMAWSGTVPAGRGQATIMAAGTGSQGPTTIVLAWGENGTALVPADTGNMLNGEIVMDGDGNLLCALAIDMNAGLLYDIYGQKLDAAGRLAWDMDHGVPVQAIGGHQHEPRIILDGTGRGAIITWWDFFSGYRNIRAQRVNATGDQQWAAGGVEILNGGWDCDTFDVIADGQGGAFISWSDMREGNRNIYAQRVNATGDVQWAANGITACNAVSGQSNPTLASDGAGGAIMAWDDSRDGGADIYAQHVTGTGTCTWGGNGTWICKAPGQQEQPRVARCGNNHWAIAWNDGRADGDVYVQVIDINHNFYRTVDGTPACNETGMQGDVVMRSSGQGVVLAWSDRRHGDDDIFIQRLNATGPMAWPNGTAAIVHAGHQARPCIDVDGAGNAYIAWFDERTGVDTDIYCQKLRKDGTPAFPAGGVPVNVGAGVQWHVSVARDGNGGAFVGFSRPDQPGVDKYFVQHVIDNHAPVLTTPGDTVVEVGAIAHLEWTATDATVNTTAHVTTINGTHAAGGSWVSGVPFSVQVNTSVAGVFNYTVVVSDGYGGLSTGTAIVTIVVPVAGAVIALVVAGGAAVVLLWILDRRGVIKVKASLDKIRTTVVKRARR